jgi:hypothetical protein
MKKVEKKVFYLSLFILSAALMYSCSSEEGKNNVLADVNAAKQNPKSSDIISSWPDKPRRVAGDLIKQYGEPQEMTASMLIWNNNGNWKRTIVSKEEINHNFPAPHTDFVKQFIDYKVPVDKFDDLAAFDGSVVVERTRGEIFACCDKEAMNILALNLANDVVSGSKTVNLARDFYGKTAMKFMMGSKPDYTQRLQFAVAKGGTADPDQSILNPNKKDAASNKENTIQY